ncbi:site-specific integrase [Streptomyces nojiriensis]|uniref:site-specific integrase n=1 Tax=Streptomyces nojiriensis TaxID=66374 RepID=UPI0036DD69C0
MPACAPCGSRSHTLAPQPHSTKPTSVVWPATPPLGAARHQLPSWRRTPRPGHEANAYLTGARRLADQAPAPFQDGVHRWIDVLCGTAPRPSRPLAPSTVRSYVHKASPCLQAWHAVGINELSAITAEHVQQTLAPLLGEARKSLLGALRSLFRALKREKLIFRDPTRGISLTTARALPPPPDRRPARWRSGPPPLHSRPAQPRPGRSACSERP